MLSSIAAAPFPDFIAHGPRLPPAQGVSHASTPADGRMHGPAGKWRRTRSGARPCAQIHTYGAYFSRHTQVGAKPLHDLQAFTIASGRRRGPPWHTRPGRPPDPMAQDGQLSDGPIRPAAPTLATKSNRLEPLPGQTARIKLSRRLGQTARTDQNRQPQPVQVAWAAALPSPHHAPAMLRAPPAPDAPTPA